MSEGTLIAQYRNIDNDRTVEVEDDGSRAILYIVRDGGPALSASLTPATVRALRHGLTEALRRIEARRV